MKTTNPGSEQPAEEILKAGSFGSSLKAHSS